MMMKNMNNKKTVALLCAVVMLIAIPVSASAVTFRDKQIPAWRTSTLLASGTPSKNSDSASGNLSMISGQLPGASSGMYLGVSDPNGAAGSEIHPDGTGPFSIDYDYTETKGTRLTLYGGFDAAGQYGYVSGNVTF